MNRWMPPRIVLALVVVLMVAVAGSVWWRPRASVQAPAVTETPLAATPPAPPAEPPKERKETVPLTRGDTFVSYGRILAVQYTSSGRTLTGVGFVATKTDKMAYYDLAGRSLRKSFLKSPLEFSRVTSGFTYARPHPILGGVRPHLAIDYAAPVGTPVRAVADGTIVRAGWNEGNGIQVHLRHRSGYETQYNHLERLDA